RPSRRATCRSRPAPGARGPDRGDVATRSWSPASWSSADCRRACGARGAGVASRTRPSARRGPPPAPPPLWHPGTAPSGSWRAFLANHRPRIRAADLLTVQTLTLRTLYVLVFVAHGRRELVHFAVTAHPTAAWVRRQLINATPWGRTPAYLVRDRDAV